MSFTAKLVGAGELQWQLTFANGSFGVIADHSGRCGAGRVRLHGRCRPSQAVYAHGSSSAGAAGRIVKLVARPSRLAALALARGRRTHRELRLTLTVVFRPAGAGAAPLKLTRTIALRPGRA